VPPPHAPTQIPCRPHPRAGARLKPGRIAPRDRAPAVLRTASAPLCSLGTEREVLLHTEQLRIGASPLGQARGTRYG
jgi:hypothetical protein